MIYYLTVFSVETGNNLMNFTSDSINTDYITNFLCAIYIFSQRTFLKENKCIDLIKLGSVIIKIIRIFEDFDVELIIIHDERDDLEFFIEEIKDLVSRYNNKFKRECYYNLAKRNYLKDLLLKTVKKYNEISRLELLELLMIK